MRQLRTTRKVWKKRRKLGEVEAEVDQADEEEADNAEAEVAEEVEEEEKAEDIEEALLAEGGIIVRRVMIADEYLYYMLICLLDSASPVALQAWCLVLVCLSPSLLRLLLALRLRLFLDLQSRLLPGL
jgi:hypothetical protein